MLRVMLDSNIFDEIIKTPGLAGQLRSLTASGRLDIVVTHVQEDELAGIQDIEKRRAIQQMPRRLIPTAVSVLDVRDLDRRASGRVMREGWSTTHCMARIQSVSGMRSLP
jgi:hypothetical protein